MEKNLVTANSNNCKSYNMFLAIEMLQWLGSTVFYVMCSRVSELKGQYDLFLFSIKINNIIFKSINL